MNSERADPEERRPHYAPLYCLSEN